MASSSIDRDLANRIVDCEGFQKRWNCSESNFTRISHPHVTASPWPQKCETVTAYGLRFIWV